MTWAASCNNDGLQTFIAAMSERLALFVSLTHALFKL